MIPKFNLLTFLSWRPGCIVWFAVTEFSYMLYTISELFLFASMQQLNSENGTELRLMHAKKNEELYYTIFE